MAQHCLWILLLCLQTCRLGKPKITQNSITSTNSSCNVTLTCSVQKEEKDVSYRWSSLEEEGNILRIIQSPEDQESTYTCTAWNPVSNSSNSISSRNLCADIIMGLRSHHTGLLSVLAVLFLLVLILSPVLLFRLYKKRQDAASKKIVYEHIVVPRNNQPAENRIYDEISQSKVLSSKKEQVNTIYSIVQNSDKMGKTSTCDRKPLGTSSYEMVI
ncbi:PREDICTED: SLAM family member 5 [Chrysochloris asiatica]|uniref:SLAM family member 5 n=1 Tax=Chrysochloris asiatica TaxID=185453 RepID=A0A9B0TC02_CHRAS|nr:PREDICTED: SLAM family member 5 [Chrysochloris asiatica]